MADDRYVSPCCGLGVERRRGFQVCSSCGVSCTELMLTDLRKRIVREGMERAEDAAHNAIHDAVYGMAECDRIKTAVETAIRAAMEEL